MDILHHVKQKVDVTLGRDTPNWRALNACPPCNYEVQLAYTTWKRSVSLTLIKLQDEVPLVPKALHAFDGNYSTKWAANAGLVDTWPFVSDYLKLREYVNKFEDEVKRKAPDDQDEVNTRCFAIQ